MRRFKGICLEDNTPEVAAPEAALNNAESLETDLIEVAETEADGQAADAQVEDAGEVMDALEDIADVMEEAQENGGLDRAGAQIAEIAVESLCARVGIDYARVGMPSMESFGGSSSRAASTRMALESVNDVAKRVWESIKKAIRKAMDWIQNFFEKIFGAAGKLQSRAKELKSRAQNLTGTAKEKQFESESLSKQLVVGTAIDSPKNAAYIGGLVKVILDGYTTERKKAIDRKIHILSGTGVDIELDNIQADSGMKTVPNGADLYGKLPDSCQYYSSDEMPGRQALVAVLFTKKGAMLSNSEDVTAYCAQTANIRNVSKDEPKAVKIPTLAAPDMAKICDSVENYAGLIAEFKKGLDENRKFKKALLDVVESIDKRDKPTDEKSDSKQLFTNLRKIAQNTLESIDKPIVPMNVYVLKTGKALLDHVEQSINQYGKKD